MFHASLAFPLFPLYLFFNVARGEESRLIEGGTVMFTRQTHNTAPSVVSQCRNGVKMARSTAARECGCTVTCRKYRSREKK